MVYWHLKNAVQKVYNCLQHYSVKFLSFGHFITYADTGTSSNIEPKRFISPLSRLIDANSFACNNVILIKLFTFFYPYGWAGRKIHLVCIGFCNTKCLYHRKKKQIVKFTSEMQAQISNY